MADIDKVAQQELAKNVQEKTSSLYVIDRLILTSQYYSYVEPQKNSHKKNIIWVILLLLLLMGLFFLIKFSIKYFS